MPVHGGSVVCAPGPHHVISAPEGTAFLMIAARSEPGAGPGIIRTFPQCIRHFIRERDRPAFRDLQHRPESLHQVQAHHGNRHLRLCDKTGRISAAAEISIVGRRPLGGFRHFVNIFIGHFPPFPAACIALFVCADAGEIQGGSTGVDQMDKTVRVSGVSFNLITGHPFNRLPAPVGADVREHRGPSCQLLLEQHAEAVQHIIFGGKDVGFPRSVIVKGSGEEGFRIVAVGIEIRPLALSLEAAGDRIMSQRFFGEFLSQLLIAAHQVFDDHVHFDRELPLLVLHLAGFLDPVGILVKAFPAFFFGPGEGSLILFFVVDSLTHAADDFHLIYGFDAHAEVRLDEILVDDGTADSHGDRSDLQIGSSSQRGHRHCSAAESKQHLSHIVGDLFRVRFLHFMPVHAESRKALLRMGCQHRSKVDRARALGGVQAPDAFDCGGIHIHGLGAVAPAGRNRQGNIHAFSLEFFSAGRAFTDASDR